jgi:hypothetical protein
MSAGKGDAPRPVNLKVYRDNYDRINWKKNRQFIEHPTIEDARRESHLEFMKAMGYNCATEEEAYRLRGLLDM